MPNELKPCLKCDRPAAEPSICAGFTYLACECGWGVGSTDGRLSRAMWNWRNGGDAKWGSLAMAEKLTLFRNHGAASLPPPSTGDEWLTQQLTHWGDTQDQRA